MSLLSKLELLAKVQIHTWLEKVQDPERELLARMKTLREALEDGRRELAQSGAALATYEEAETACQKQIEFHLEMATRFATSNEAVALDHLQEKKELEGKLAQTQQETADFRAQLERLEATVDAVAQQLAKLEKAYSAIEAMDTTADQLTLLRQIAKEEVDAAELQEAAQRRIDIAEVHLELEGVDTPHAQEVNPELLAELRKLQTQGGKAT